MHHKQSPGYQALHCSLVRLHLVAVAVNIPALQDYSLDSAGGPLLSLVLLIWASRQPYEAQIQRVPVTRI